MMQTLRWLIEHVEEALCAAIMTFMVGLGFMNVVTRYLGFSLAYTEEVLVMLMVWLTMFGAAVGMKRGSHLSMSFLRDRCPPGLQAWLDMLNLAATLATLVAVAWLCLAYQIPDEILMDTRTSALDIPVWYYTLAVPVGGVSVMARAVQAYLAGRAARRRPA
jgi:TRAP-type C4-dicarboxylate transport system permease small subunit